VVAASPHEIRASVPDQVETERQNGLRERAGKAKRTFKKLRRFILKLRSGGIFVARGEARRNRGVASPKVPGPCSGDRVETDRCRKPARSRASLPNQVETEDAKVCKRPCSRATMNFAGINTGRN